MDSNNRRIARNTAFLYFRMLFLMVISLYTSRVLLHALGVEDFGINNVVGGFVVMFAFVNRSMSSVTQRFLTYELGRGDAERLNKVFNTTLIIHLVLGVLIILLAETVGLWFVYNKMVIPAERFTAALWVFHVSVLITAIGVSYVPFNALIISHERMNVFAWISILEGIIKIAIAFCIYLSKGDKLIYYAILMLASQILIVSIYIKYSTAHFSETKMSMNFYRPLLKEILGFFGWNFYGTMGSVVVNQGINVLLNMFFGVVINAARGIAIQVESAVLAFAENIQTAINPQITKTYAQNKLVQMHRLIFFNCKVTFFVMFVLSLPICIETDTILHLWLDSYPDFTVSFLRLLLLGILFNVLSNPFAISINSTGHVKRFYQVTGTLMLLMLPICYVVLKLTQKPDTAFICLVFMQILIFVFRLSFTKPLINLIWRDVFSVLLHLLIVAILSTFLVLLVHVLDISPVFRLILVVFVTFLFTCIMMYIFALSNEERNTIKQFVKEKIGKR